MSSSLMRYRPGCLAHQYQTITHTWGWKMCTNELESGNNIIQIYQILICFDNEAVKSYENLNPINIYDHISGCNTDIKGVLMSQISKGSTRILGTPTTIIIHPYTINNWNSNFRTLFDLFFTSYESICEITILVLIHISILVSKIIQIEIWTSDS